MVTSIRTWVVIPFLLVCQILSAGINEEFRATWAVTWDIYSSYGNPEASQRLCRQVMDRHKRANMNAVLWQVRQNGEVYYPSSYEPWGRYIGYGDPGYDPLAYAIEEAHKRGLELHAWVNVFHVSAFYPGAPAYEHQNWICRDGYGRPMTSHRWFSPGLDSVREYTIKVIMEIVRNYDIDGIHLDYVRWSEYTSTKEGELLAKSIPEERSLDGFITPELLKALQEAPPRNRYLYDIEHPWDTVPPEGFATWEDWWRWSVTEFVRELHDSIQAVKPWVRLSAAVLGRYNWGGWQAYGTVFQDAALWFNEGYVDQLTPMHYHWTTPAGFYNMLCGEYNSWEPYIQEGIAAGRLYTVGPGSYILDMYGVWDNHPAIVDTCRTISWVDGFQFFSYATWCSHDYWDEAGSTFFNRKTKIRATRLIDSIPPEPVQIELNKIDSLTYAITVLLGGATSDTNYWFAIYRSTDSIIDVSNDDIIHIHFGDSSFTYVDSFDGTQDYNGRYYYAATVFDRYWNESDISNVEVSDSIPSFAPIVVYTIPADSDSISIADSIIVGFSKTMDTTSFDDTTISIEPHIGIAQLLWSDGNKTLTIVPDGYFQYDTWYELTIQPSASDINGRLLDGNADGIEGDPFVLRFKTFARDDIPPHIVYTYPTSGEDSFDIRDIITVVFDEPIDTNTLDTVSVRLYCGWVMLPIAFTHTVMHGKSILCIQPKQPLTPNTDYTVLLSHTHAITDTAGNPMSSHVVINFHTAAVTYTELVMVEDFTPLGTWWQPEQSGSTHGIDAPNTEWGYTDEVYPPASTPAQSAYLQYEWNESDPPWLLREYLAGGAPREVIFDTTYVLQCYVFGDHSYNKFRFCVDDSTMDESQFHEVSKWITLDWYGWRLVEWQLSDPNSVGYWTDDVGDGTLNPPLRFDSFQLTHEVGASISGVIYIDELRLVRKAQIGVEEPSTTCVTLSNHPNPFNTKTNIVFSLPKPGVVELTVYDVTGRVVATLVDGLMGKGRHEVTFHAPSDMAAGVYFYSLRFDGKLFTNKLLLVR